MSDFRENIKYDRTRENREDELEASNLKARIDNKLNKFRKLNYENIKEELEMLQEVLKDYERLKNYEDINEEEYELLKFKIERLSRKQTEIESEMKKDASWEDYKNEELRRAEQESGNFHTDGRTEERETALD